MMMAGLDGIQNKIHPGDPMDKNLYDLPPEELKDIPTVCGSLREALTSLSEDHAFLLRGDVFSRDFIESYIELKWEEVYAFEHTRTRSNSRCTTRSDGAPSPPSGDPAAVCRPRDLLFSPSKPGWTAQNNSSPRCSWRPERRVRRPQPQRCP
jgi:hypothetical protein